MDLLAPLLPLLWGFGLPLRADSFEALFMLLTVCFLWSVLYQAVVYSLASSKTEKKITKNVTFAARVSVTCWP
jgi:formate hydrogenlyase subunit 3/multisubunit Na+/H+ antiporter MnhD subunit